MIQGDGLFVAGGMDMMVFNISIGAMPLQAVAVCGAACRQVFETEGQNAHGLAYLEVQSRPLVVLTAQQDNALGVVELMDAGLRDLVRGRRRGTTPRSHLHLQQPTLLGDVPELLTTYDGLD